jgi:hypothetical protein
LLAMFSGVILRGCCCLFALAVFLFAAEFNGDVSIWDVSRVTTLFQSKCRGGEGGCHCEFNVMLQGLNLRAVRGCHVFFFLPWQRSLPV